MASRIMVAFMRQSRIKAAPGEDGIYHIIDRIVGGAFLLGSVEKEMYLAVMWRVAEFLSIDICDYCVMDTHAHNMVRAPGKVELTDQELLERLRKYKGENNQEVRKFEKAMKFKGPMLDTLREKFMRRMGNISEFKRSHKQIFTRWYNERHKRIGTLWTERFKSLIAEDILPVRLDLAAYIDLNPVRAEIVEDPKDYRFCGYAAAVAGDERCRRGIMRVLGSKDWDSASAEYRLKIIQDGHKKRPGKRGSIGRELLLKTLNEKGFLPREDLLHLRIAYFTEGLALGTQPFVKKIFNRHRSHFGKKRKQTGFPLHGFGESSLRVMRQLRKNPFS